MDQNSVRVMLNFKYFHDLDSSINEKVLYLIRRNEFQIISELSQDIHERFIKKHFSDVSDNGLHLYVLGCIVPHWEHVTVLRENDIIRILPSVGCEYYGQTHQPYHTEPAKRKAEPVQESIAKKKKKKQKKNKDLAKGESYTERTVTSSNDNHLVNETEDTNGNANISEGCQLDVSVLEDDVQKMEPVQNEESAQCSDFSVDADKDKRKKRRRSKIRSRPRHKRGLAIGPLLQDLQQASAKDTAKGTATEITTPLNTELEYLSPNDTRIKSVKLKHVKFDSDDDSDVKKTSTPAMGYSNREYIYNYGVSNQDTGVEIANASQEYAGDITLNRESDNIEMNECLSKTEPHQLEDNYTHMDTSKETKYSTGAFQSIYRNDKVQNKELEINDVGGHRNNLFPLNPPKYAVDLLSDKRRQNVSKTKDFTLVANAQVFDRRKMKRKPNVSLTECEQLSINDVYSNKSYVLQNGNSEKDTEAKEDASSVSTVVKTVKDYACLPNLYGAPRVGDKIAYKEAKVINFDPASDKLTLEITACEVKSRNQGRFHVKMEDENEILMGEQEFIGKQIEILLNAIVEPKLLA